MGNNIFSDSNEETIYHQFKNLKIDTTPIYSNLDFNDIQKKRKELEEELKPKKIMTFDSKNNFLNENIQKDNKIPSLDIDNKQIQPFEYLNQATIELLNLVDWDIKKNKKCFDFYFKNVYHFVSNDLPFELFYREYSDTYLDEQTNYIRFYLKNLSQKSQRCTIAFSCL